MLTTKVVVIIIFIISINIIVETLVLIKELKIIITGITVGRAILKNYSNNNRNNNISFDSCSSGCYCFHNTENYKTENINIFGDYGFKISNKENDNNSFDNIKMNIFVICTATLVKVMGFREAVFSFLDMPRKARRSYLSLYYDAVEYVVHELHRRD